MPDEVLVFSGECDEPIRQTGWGLYHQFMVGMASVCAFSQASAASSMPFASPLAICSMAPSNDKLIAIDTCFLFGMAFGGFFLSSISDITGRKTMITVTLLIMFGSNFAASFSHEVYMIMFLVFFLGSGLAANANCVKIHLAEILPTERRGTYLVFTDLFWTSGYMVSSSTDYLLTPFDSDSYKRDIQMKPWRLMYALSSVVCILVSCASALAQQSPRYLIYKKKYPEALNTLKKMYAINNSKFSETYALRERDLMGRIDQFSLDSIQETRSCYGRLYNRGIKLKKCVLMLFRKRFLLLTVVLIGLKLTVSFGILSTNIWLAKALDYSNRNISSFSGSDIMHIETTTSCKFKLNEELYRNFFLVALSIWMGQIVLLMLIDRIGRKICLRGLMCVGASFGQFNIPDIFLLKFLLASIFMMGCSLVESTLNVVTVEAYPTAMRGTAIGVTQFLPFFVAAIVKIFLLVSFQKSFIIVGSVSLIAVILVYFIPELRGKPMVE